jgi:hypothetical protein
MILPISPMVALKATALGLSEIHDCNGDGAITFEDVNILAAKKTVAAVTEIKDEQLPTNPIVAKNLVK